MRKFFVLGVTVVGAALLMTTAPTSSAPAAVLLSHEVSTSNDPSDPPVGHEHYIDVPSHADCVDDGEAGIERGEWVSYVCADRGDGWWRLWVRYSW